MTEAERLRTEIVLLRFRKENTAHQACVMQVRANRLTGAWRRAAEAEIDELDAQHDRDSNEIGRLKAELAALESSVTLVDIGNRTNLSAI